MNFKIGDDETLGDSIRRVACEQIEGAMVASRAARNGNGSPVHRTRKHLKKARAALRLLTTEVGGRRFRREDRRLRKVGRLISDMRDAEARLETVKHLREGVNAPRRRGFRETEKLLTFERDNFLAAFAGWEDEAARRLARAKNEITNWPRRELTHEQVCRTVCKSYCKGRRALARTRKHASASRFHELRKRAKELWYQLRFLRPLQPSVLGEMSRDLKTVTEQLGQAHDLCFVAQRLRSLASGSRSKRNTRALRALLEAREKDLWRSATVLAERFYALKPREFAAPIAHYFRDQEHAQMREARALAPAA